MHKSEASSRSSYLTPENAAIIAANLEEFSAKDGPERKYSCRICGFRLLHKYGIYQHIRTHANESLVRPYSCPFPNCGKKYILKEHLRDHRVVHTGEKNHVCQVCGFRTFYEMDLLQHARTHKIAYVCQYPGCDRKYIGERRFAGHLVKHAESDKMARPMYRHELRDMDLWWPKSLEEFSFAGVTEITLEEHNFTFRL